MSIFQHNNVLLENHLFTLFKTMAVIRQFDLSALPESLTQSLSNLNKELSSYEPHPSDCTQPSPEAKHNPTLNAIPDVIPTPPPLPNFTDDSEFLSTSICSSASQKKKKIGKENLSRSITRTPKRSLRKTALCKRQAMSKIPMRTDLIKGRDSLRKTPGHKSPGGTPVRKRRQVLHLSNPGDLLTYALRKKFRNMRQLYDSPTGSDSCDSREQSFNMSID